jgi:hypothetical protein
MSTRFFWSAVFLAAVSTRAVAQDVDPQCPPGALVNGSPDNTMVSQDACQKSIDLFRYLAPEIGVILAGGNATQGLAGTLGGLGHFSVGIRGNALDMSLPQVDRVTPNTRGARQDIYPIEQKFLGGVTADLAVGVLKGFSTSGFGSADVLVSATYLPAYTGTSIEVKEPDGSFKLGLGAKVGVLRETATLPGISVSYLVRETPRVDITAKSGEDRLFLNDVSVKAKSWRAVAAKKLLFLGVGAGFGQDAYDSRASITVSVAPRQATQGGTGGPVSLTQSLTRNSIFATAWFSAQVLRIVGEIGRVSGGSISTYNSFEGVQPADARTYYSLGVSFGR